ncbi:MAG: uncharacterized protein A8A55_2544 [Amphiamblys sp. WSBS2006]|nr:MAG: uncharacterized protein A8A55_2544 [Amphiamblys sp. WSBS2006]
MSTATPGSSEAQRSDLSQAPTFTGDGASLRGWKLLIGNYFELYNVVGAKRGNVAIATLRGKALDWVVRTYADGTAWSGEGGFEKLYEELEKEFTSKKTPVEIRHQLSGLRQNEKSVDEYVERFVSIRGTTAMGNEESIFLFTNGLRTDIAKEIRLKEPETMQDATRLARRLEAVQQALQVNEPMDLSAAQTRAYRGQRSAGAYDARSQGVRKCWNCGEPGHIARFCRKARRQDGQNQRRWRAQGVQDDGDSPVNSQDRVLYIGSVRRKDGPRLLCISGTVNGRRVKMLIDSGASNNFIAKSAVGYLGLRAIKCRARRILLANGSECTADEKCEYVKIRGERDFKITATVIPGIHTYDMILGQEFLFKYNPVIDWKTGRIMFEGSAEVNTVVEEKSKSEAQNKAQNKVLGTLRGVDIVHRIETGDARPIAVPPRRLSVVEQEELKKQLEELQKGGIIRESSSPWAAPIIFASKKDGGLRMCIDYRRLNNVTKKESMPIPRIDETIDRLQEAKIFSAIDLKSGYHQIPMAEEDIEKTAFTTRYGLFEYTKMPFGLCNAPATFTRTMNRVLRPFLDRYVVVYLDDILVYSKNKEEHKKHVEEVMATLEKHGLLINEKKCHWNQEEVNFLGYVLGKGRVKMDPGKKDAILKMRRPKNTTEMRCLLGMANFYRNFIPKYGEICSPLYETLKKENEFKWGKEQESALMKLKESFYSDQVLKIPGKEGTFVLRTDASIEAIGGVLLQDERGSLQTVGFESRKTTNAEKNYPVHELELLGIIHCLKKWRCHLEGRSFLIETDNSAASHILTQKEVSRRTARWLDFISIFDFRITHRKGKDNPVADALSRLCCMSEKEGNREEKEKLVRELHALGHLGIKGTLDLVRKQWRWRGMTKMVQRIVDGCVTCQKNKKGEATRTQVTPLTPPDGPFQRWGMDFVGRMPETANGKKWILVAIDHFSKWPVAEAVQEASAKTVIEFVKKHIVANFGIPEEIITDRGSAFTAMETEKYLKETLGTKHLRTSAYHPQANGVTERFNGLLGNTLRKLTDEEGGDWDRHIDRTLAVCRARKHQATGVSPFEILFGKIPRIMKRSEEDESKTKESPIPREEARDMAQTNLQKQKEKMEEMGVARSFAEGEEVLLRQTLPRKMAPAWNGPFTIAKVLEYNTYILKYGDKTIENVVHADRLKSVAKAPRLEGEGVVPIRYENTRTY